MSIPSIQSIPSIPSDSSAPSDLSDYAAPDRAAIIRYYRSQLRLRAALRLLAFLGLMLWGMLIFIALGAICYGQGPRAIVAGAITLWAIWSVTYLLTHH